MNELYARSLIAGVCFGLWPLLMNRSGLTGGLSAAVFSLGTLIIISPFALYEFRGTNFNVIWTMAIGACVFGALGLLSFNGMLSKATKENVGSLFVLMVVTQIATSAIYKVITIGGLTISKAIGFTAAILAAFLLI